jgi:protein pelota
MRLLRLEQNEEGRTEVKVSVSSSEDLWHLYNLIVVGDHVRTKTKRKIAKETTTGNGTTETRVVVLEIEVHQIHFDPQELRLQGVNRKESEWVKLGAHHTLSLKADIRQDVVIVKREWDEVLDERLQEACNQEGKADTAAIAMDFGLANVCLVTDSLTYTKQRIEMGIAKKHKANGSSRDASIKRFFSQVLDAIVSHIPMDDIKVVLVCSPGHVREEFRSFVVSECTKAETGPLRTVFANMNKFVLVKTTTGCKSAIQEALSDPNVLARMDCTKSAADVLAWQSFQDMMNNDPDRCVYTPQYVFEAEQRAAIEFMLLSDEKLRSSNPVERRFYMALCASVKATGGTVNIFSSSHVTGEQLAKMSGIAAILRFPCPEIDEIPVNTKFLSEEPAMELIRAFSNQSNSATSTMSTMGSPAGSAK